MNWQPSMSWQLAKARASLNKNIRQFFEERGVIEVETPILSHGTITDVYLDAFETNFDQSSSGSQEKLFLQTSPEFAMKRLLAAGYGSIYQLSKAFRHESAGKHHNPEFTLLEWYRLGFDHWQLMNEVEEFLVALLNVDAVERYSYQDLFIEYTGLDPLNIGAKQLHIFLKNKQRDDHWLMITEHVDTLLQFIFSQYIEPEIGKDQPCFVYGFPIEQAALARVNEKDNRIADRFECYYKGIELVNGFYELTNKEEQYSRFIQDNKQRKKLSYKEKPIDKRFITALEEGLPLCSGVALGVDRLAMLALGEDHIRSVLTFDINNA